MPDMFPTITANRLFRHRWFVGEATGQGRHLGTEKLNEPSGSGGNNNDEDAGKTGSRADLPDPASSRRRDIYKIPNLISLARVCSGPVIGYWIIEGRWAEALAGIVVVGVSDWADGYIAKNWNQSTVLGSYLDPLADKVVVTCIVGSLAWVDLLPMWLAGVVIGRDAALVAASFILRAHTLGWRWRDSAEFFRTRMDEGASSGGPAARFMQPALVSKVNTALQFLLVSSAVLHEMHGVPDAQTILHIGHATAATTVASLAVYAVRSRGSRPL